MRCMFHVDFNELTGVICECLFNFDPYSAGAALISFCVGIYAIND